jgi:carboxyl-terminal processing protease
MSQRNLAWLIVVPMAVLFTGVFTYTAPPPEQDYKMVRTVVDVLAEVDKSYYRELTEAERKKLVEDMINGGLHTLDPASVYFNEEQLRQFSQDNKGTYVGIGALLGIDPKTNTLMIASPIPDSPAMEAGLQAGDLILKIDGQSSEGLDTDAARSKIKGEPGTPVTLTLLRPGAAADPFDVTLPRREIVSHPVKGVRRKADDPTRWDFIADPQYKIAVIRLVEFTRPTTKEIDEALKEAVAAGAKALVLDMRGNPGGLLDEAEHIADRFLADGVIVRTRGRHDTGRDIKAKNDGSVWEDAAKLPMAVLVDRASASAAEIVAAALQDHGRAVVVGERSYGKGSVQRSIELAGGTTALKLTTEIWLTPNGKHIHRTPQSKAEDDWGVRPNDGFEVKMTDEQVVQYFLHLREAELIRKTPGEAAKPPEKPPEPNPNPVKLKPGELPKLDPNFKDPVLEKALEHLRGKVSGAARKGGFDRA